MLPDGDFYKGFFLAAAESAGRTWTKMSLKVMQDWDILDYPLWRNGSASYSAYKYYVTTHLQDICRARWLPAVCTHLRPVPYLLLNPLPGPTLPDALRAGLPWDTLMCLRGWCKIRLGLPLLSCVSGRRSGARIQQCIFCGTPNTNAYEHVFALCPH